MIVCNFYSFIRSLRNPEIWRISEDPTLYMLLSAMDRDGVGDGSFATVRVHVSRSFFSDYPTGASLIRVSTFFVFLALFSRAGAGRILCLHRVSLQEETGGRVGERGREDSGHCGTICTKVAIAMEFKGAEEWRPMQIEAFFSPPLAGGYNIHELFAKNGPRCL